MWNHSLISSKKKFTILCEKSFSCTTLNKQSFFHVVKHSIFKNWFFFASKVQFHSWCNHRLCLVLQSQKCQHNEATIMKQTLPSHSTRFNRQNVSERNRCKFYSEIIRLADNKFLCLNEIKILKLMFLIRSLATLILIEASLFC